ncbi:hypothetical protein GCM10010430_07260 [Kitasatospora cystarginea]|uniref:Uncharacterized protein n=1 Tax=Kitasatospora cystarginea TaxID=58350 RepID=A0ABP5Q9U4_9ACTN
MAESAPPSLSGRINTLVARLRSGALPWDRKADAPPVQFGLITGGAGTAGSSAQDADGTGKGTASR